jgi:exo-beta-1,3-glucanase (GH17 family)
MGFKTVISALFLSMAMLADSASAANVGGTIGATNNNWGTGGNVASPVAITSNIIVPVGVTLTIQPGCVVAGAFTVTVNGTLLVNGTIDNYVDWSAARIVFASTTQSKIQFLKIVDYTSPTVVFPDAIDVTGASVDFEHMQIEDFGTCGINISGAASVVKINSCTIGAKSRAFSTTLGPATSVNIGADAANADITISNSILGVQQNANMIGLAVNSANPTNTKVSYTFITGPRVGKGSTENTLYLGVDPGIFDVPNMRYYLSAFSPAIDAADPADNGFANEPTPNGGRTDCGYYGGTSQATMSQLQVRNPAANQSLTDGTQFKVTWWGGMFACTKKVDYSTDNGATWTNIGTANIGDTSIMWTVPASKTAAGLIRVAYTTVNDVVTVSNPFYIDSVPPAGSLCNPNKIITNPKYFTCICYAGYRAGQAPGGAEPTYAQVQQDMITLAPYTHGIRTYGTSWRGDPNIGQDFIPHFCDSLNMNLYLGVWIDNTYTDATNQSACDVALSVIAQGHKSIKSVIVGNEFLLRVEEAQGNLTTGEATLIKWISYVRGKLPAGTSIKVTTGESYPNWLSASDNLINAVDVVYWHVHPWWEGKPINIAAEWVKTTHEEMIARIAKAGVTKPMVLAETGYPWSYTQGAAVGTEANQAQYLHDLNVYCDTVGLTYYFFEGFDEPWKASQEGGVGDKWGIWNADHVAPHLVIKNISTEIPACMMWGDPEVPTQVTGAPQAQPVNIGVVPSAYTEIRLYTLQGRLIAKMPPAKNAVAYVKQLVKSRSLSIDNVLLIDYVNNGKTAKSEKVLLK